MSVAVPTNPALPTTSAPEPTRFHPEMPGRRLRVGVLVDGDTQPAWIAALLRELRASESTELVLVVRNGATPPTAEAPRDLVDRARRWWRYRDSLPYALYRRLDRRRYLRPGDPELEEDVSALLADCPSVTVAPRMTKFCDYFDDAAVEEIRTHDLDVALRFGFRILKGESLRIARHGVWSFHHGDNRVNRGGPAGFWEVMRGEPITGAMLQVLTEELDAGLVLARSQSSTEPISVTANKCNYYWQASHLMLGALRELHARGASMLEDARARNRDWTAYCERLYVAPTAREMLGMGLGLAWRLVRRRVAAVGRRDQWLVAYRRTTPAPGRENVPDGVPYRFRELVPPPDRFWADPIPAVHDGRHYVFMEEYLYGQPARIAVSEIDAAGVASTPRVVLQRPYHMSYPFVFRWRDTWYMIPETLAQRAVELYRATRFPDEWELDRTLLTNVTAVDATLAEIDGRWWMFTGGQAPGSGETTLLNLYHAASPLGPWTAHRGNPVKVDVVGARPAGPLFKHDGAWYRPAQVGAPKYGSAIAVHRIETLSPTAFHEVEVSRLTPSWRKGLTGTHTIGAAGGLTVIDARRTIRAR